MQLTDDWINVLPNMISLARRNSRRIPEFEPLIMQHPSSASMYACNCIHGPWPEAEDCIATDAGAALAYAKTVIKGRWEKGEAAIASDANASCSYARDIKSVFPLGEPAIAAMVGSSFSYATDVIRGRFILGEKVIAELETLHGEVEWSLKYYTHVIGGRWQGWTEDQLKISPCWMYLYAKEHIKGRLPDVLHNHMLAFGMTLKDNYYVQKYFKAKKYQKRVKYRRKKRFANIVDEVNSALSTN